MRVCKYEMVLFIIFFSFLWCGQAVAADVAKIGIVNLQRVLETSDPGKAARDVIEKEKDKMLQEMKEKGAEIEALQKQLERESMVMSKERREEKEREYRIKQNDFRMLNKKNNEKMQGLQKELLDKIFNEVMELTEEIGKKEGYLLIIRGDTVMYAPGSIDISDQLIKKLNESHAKKSGD
ncbi:MAG: OmpH family outer membrane protein [Desulfobacterales bacterium]